MIDIVVVGVAVAVESMVIVVVEKKIFNKGFPVVGKH